MSGRRDLRAVILPALLLAAAIAIWAGTASGGAIVILERPDGAGFSMEFREWTSRGKCELSMQRGDVLQIEVARVGGSIDLAIRGMGGGEPYVGRDLRSGIFTVAVSEADQYAFSVAGVGATGRIVVRNLGKAR